MNYTRVGVRRPRSRLLTAMIAGFLLTTGATGQEMSALVAMQWAVLSKVLTFDRNLARMGKEVAVGVLYQPQVRRSTVVKDELLAAIDLGQSSDLRFTGTAISFTSKTDLVAILGDVDVLYKSPLRSVDLSMILAQSRRLRIATLTGVPEYVQSGVAVGIDLQGGKPRILINLNSAMAEGVDFGSGLLKLAKIVQ